MDETSTESVFVRQFGGEHFQGHDTAQPQILREVDDAHSPTADLTLHLVARDLRTELNGLISGHLLKLASGRLGPMDVGKPLWRDVRRGPSATAAD